LRSWGIVKHHSRLNNGVVLKKLGIAEKKRLGVKLFAVIVDKKVIIEEVVRMLLKVRIGGVTKFVLC
jgi:hypothetical protein